MTLMSMLGASKLQTVIVLNVFHQVTPEMNEVMVSPTFRVFLPCSCRIGIPHTAHMLPRLIEM